MAKRRYLDFTFTSGSESIDIDINGLTKSMINNHTSALNSFVYHSRQVFAAEFESNLKREAPRDTGNLRNKIKVTVNGEQLKISGPRYMRQVINGRSAMQADSGKAFKFTINGKTIYATRIRGSRANDFITRAFEVTLKDAESLSKKALARAIRDIE